jgi:hypothetical protein
MAEFTTCSANWDFSQPLYATQSNWYDCDGSHPNLLWHQGSAGVTMRNPCNVHQFNDGGNVVMHYQWLTSYDNTWGSHYGNGQFNQVGGQTYNNFNHSPSVTFPNMYLETVARIARVCDSCAQNSGGPNDVYIWNGDGTLEIDVFEINSDTGGVASGGVTNAGFLWGTWISNNLPPGYKVTDYHKYGALLTSDGATTKYVCMFVDDRLQKCVSGGAASMTTRSWILASAGSNAGTATQNIDLYVKYVRIWSCPTWQGSDGDASHMCNGSTLYNSGGLTYWH